MKHYQPTFSKAIMLIQLVLSLATYNDYVRQTRADPLLCMNYDGGIWLFFVVVIGLYEMTTKPSLLKKVLSVFLASIILGQILPIVDLYSAIFNTSWVVGLVVLALLVFRVGQHFYRKIFLKNE